MVISTLQGNVGGERGGITPRSPFPGCSHGRPQRESRRTGRHVVPIPPHRRFGAADEKGREQEGAGVLPLSLFGGAKNERGGVWDARRPVVIVGLQEPGRGVKEATRKRGGVWDSRCPVVIVGLQEPGGRANKVTR